MESFRKAHSARQIKSEVSVTKHPKTTDLKRKLKDILLSYTQNELAALRTIADESSNEQLSFTEEVSPSPVIQKGSPTGEKEEHKHGSHMENVETSLERLTVEGSADQQTEYKHIELHNNEGSSSVSRAPSEMSEFDGDQMLASQIKERLAVLHTMDEMVDTSSETSIKECVDLESSSLEDDSSNESNVEGKFVLKCQSKCSSDSNASIEIQKILESDNNSAREDFEETTNMNSSPVSSNSTPLCVSIKACKNKCDIEEFFQEYDNFMRETKKHHYDLDPSQAFIVDDLSDSQPHIKDIDLNSKNKPYSTNESCNFDEMEESCPESENIEETFDDNSDSQSTVDVYNADSGCVLVLQHPGELYFHGKLKGSTLCGHVNVYGFKLGQSYQEIFAPRHGHSLKFETIEEDSDKYGLFGKLTSLGVSVADTEYIVTSLKEFDVVLHLLPLETKSLDFVESMFVNESLRNVTLFKKTSKILGQECLFTAADILNCSFYEQKPQKCLEIHPQWKDVVQCGRESRGRTVLCGGKGVGKSTMLRYYINNLLSDTEVLLVDLDPGQAEFTCAGNVSAVVVSEPLLGPNFTHLRTPNKSLHMAMIDVYQDIRLYISAVKELIDYCINNEALSKLPWIVNTMGLCNNVGEELMSYIILQTQANLVVQLHSNTQSKCFDNHLTFEHIKSRYEKFSRNRRLKQHFDGNVLEKSKRYVYVLLNSREDIKIWNVLKPRNERYLNFLAYFGKCLEKISSDNILDIVPYEVRLQSLRIGVNVKMDDDSILRLLNGKIVAMCWSDHPKHIFKISRSCEVFGYGIVRGVDIEKQFLYIITPITHKLLANVNTLVYSDWTPTLEVNLNRFKPGTFVPYHTAVSGENRQLLNVPQRRFNPLQLLRMKNS